jgi:hypothetical protein
MSFEDQTQRLRVQAAGTARDTAREPATDTTTALPSPLNLAGPLDLAGPTAPAGDTDVLSLDDLFDEPRSTAPGPSTAEAPTWTAMPVVAVRSEPITPLDPPQPPQPRAKSDLGRRVRSDAAKAWDETRARSGVWLRRDDHALMLMTALVAIVLIIVVAALGA